MSETVKRMMKYPASNAFKARNPGMFNPTHKSMVEDVESLLPSKRPINDPGAIAPHFMRPSTDEEKLNKTERAYLKFLRDINPHWIGIQCTSFKLGDDCRYNPDFLVINHEGRLQAHEVKGFMRDDALVKLKVFARMYSWIELILAVNVKGRWLVTTVKP